MNVDEVLNKQKLPFKVSGNDYLIKCLNPSHDDSNPSMRVDRVTGIFHCFSCGFKGNIFSRYGISQSQLDKVRKTLKNKIEKVKIEQVGFQIPEKAVFWDQDYRNISASTYLKFKAFIYEDEFPNRLVFPIIDITNKIVAFTARSFDEFAKPKYKVHPPKATVPLYPLLAKPKNGSIILVEGIFDLLNLYDKGITNVMCSFGTQTLNEEKLSLLRLLGVHNIDIFFDGDEPGQAAAEKVLPLAESLGFETRNIVYNGFDPGSLSVEQIERLKRAKWQEYY
jgi:DNA primase